MATPKNVSSYRTLERGIRVREHLSRRYDGSADQYFTLRFRMNGKTLEKGLGWASCGWTLLKARVRLLECLKAVREGREPEIDLTDTSERPVTLHMVWQDYQHTLTDTMRRVCQSFIRCHLASLMPQRVSDLRTSHLDDLRSLLELKGLRPQSVKHVLAFIRQLVRWGAKRGYCEMPGLSQLYFEMPKFDNTTMEYLTPKQILRLLEGLDAYPNQVLASSMRLALCTGMRRGAIFALRWEDIDLEHQTIRLRAEAAKSGRTAYIAMNDDCRKVLEQLASLTGKTEGVIFGQEDASYGQFRTFVKYIKEYLPKGYRPYYCLRHTFASILANAGVNQITLQRAMTHASVTMVQRYAHLQPATMAEASAAITRHLADINAMLGDDKETDLPY